MVRIVEIGRDGHGVIEVDGTSYTFFYDAETGVVFNQIHYELIEQYELETLIEIEYNERFS